jgi:hypothetical protein
MNQFKATAIGMTITAVIGTFLDPSPTVSVMLALMVIAQSFVVLAISGGVKPEAISKNLLEDYVLGGLHRRGQVEEAVWEGFEIASTLRDVSSPPTPFILCDLVCNDGEDPDSYRHTRGFLKPGSSNVYVEIDESTLITHNRVAPDMDFSSLNVITPVYWRYFLPLKRQN